jgi:uncharacterized protein YfbU (UPF0304 family)
MAYTLANIENPVAYENAIKRNIIANARKTWLANTPRALEILDAVEAGREYNKGTVIYKEGFMGSMASALDSYGKLTPKQSEAVLKGIDARAARKAEWDDKKAAIDATRAFVGTVGEKITLTLKVVHIVELDGSFGTIYINICEDADNNTIIYKGNAKGFPEKGETATITATVKEHGVRNGVKQTVIQRPKLATL